MLEHSPRDEQTLSADIKINNYESYSRAKGWFNFRHLKVPRNNDYNLENRVFSKSSFSCPSCLHLTNLFVNSIYFANWEEVPRPTWLDGVIGFRGYGILGKNLIITWPFCGKNNFDIMTASPLPFTVSYFAMKISKGLAHRKKYREQLLPWPVCRVSYVFIVPGTRTVWLAFYAASTVPALHLTILLSRRANSRESPTNRRFQIPKALKCTFTAPVGLFPAELFPRYLVFFHRVPDRCHYNNYFELCRGGLFRSSKFCKKYVSISRCVLTNFSKKVD